VQRKLFNRSFNVALFGVRLIQEIKKAALFLPRVVFCAGWLCCKIKVRLNMDYLGLGKKQHKDSKIKMLHLLKYFFPSTKPSPKIRITGVSE
jgi:hypothetical protein